MKIFFCAIVASLLSAGAAQAYCMAPGRAPLPPQSYERPRPPSCLSNARFGEDNDCDPRVLDRYSNDVAAYIKKLDDFVFAAERYAEAAAKYAQCEADDARESLGK